MKNRFVRIVKISVQQKAFIAIVIMLILMSFSKTNFYTSYNILDLLNSASILILVGFGLTLVIVAGGIDLSVGGTLVVSGIVAIKMMDVFPIWLSIIIAILTGTLIGAINGYFAVIQKTEPFIITLGMGLLLTGLAMQLTDAHPISPKNIKFMSIANGSVIGKIPNLVVIVVVMLALCYWLLRFTQFGRNCYAIGGDYEVAEYSGINAKLIKTATYMLSGSFAALAGVLLSSKLNSGSAVYGETTALIVICSVVVGGTSLAGGVGGVVQTVLGLLVFAIMENGMNMLGIDSYIQLLLKGIVIVVIISLDSYSRKQKREAV